MAQRKILKVKYTISYMVGGQILLIFTTNMAKSQACFLEIMSFQRPIDKSI